jgi:hypothetical protein
LSACVGALTGAAHGEKSAEWLVQCNGCHERDWETRAGTVELSLADSHDGLFSISPERPLSWGVFEKSTD